MLAKVRIMSPAPITSTKPRRDFADNQCAAQTSPSGRLRIARLAQDLHHVPASQLEAGHQSEDHHRKQ